MAKTLRCPFCPDAFSSLDDYRVHFGLLHAIDLVSGERRVYAPPHRYTPPARKPHDPDPDDDLTLYD